MCGWQVKLCDPLVTHGPYLSALRWWYTTLKALYKYQTLLYFYFYSEVLHALHMISQRSRLFLTEATNISFPIVSRVDMISTLFLTLSFHITSLVSNKWWKASNHFTFTSVAGFFPVCTVGVLIDKTIFIIISVGIISFKYVF